MHDEEYIMCVNKESPHIDDSILTNCCECDREIWCSITNAHRKTICLSCVRTKIKEEDCEFGITPETMEEVDREMKKRRKNEK